MPNSPVAFSPAAAAQLGNIHAGSASFGPLKITWNIDISIPQITADATLYGVSIGHVLLNKANPHATLGGSIGIATAKVDLTADFTKKELDYDVDVDAFGHTIVKKAGKLFTW